MTKLNAQSVGLEINADQAASSSFDFFDALGDTVIIGPTQINVRDVRVLISLV